LFFSYMLSFILTYQNTTKRHFIL